MRITENLGFCSEAATGGLKYTEKTKLHSLKYFKPRKVAGLCLGR